MKDTDATEIVLAQIREERAKQREKWGNDHDDARLSDELTEAAAFLLDPAAEVDPEEADDDTLGWAVRLKAKHHDDRRRQLLIGIALAVAEVERLDREKARLRASGMPF